VNKSLVYFLANTIFQFRGIAAPNYIVVLCSKYDDYSSRSNKKTFQEQIISGVTLVDYWAP